MSNIQNILVICGGESAEHEVSIISARNVLEQLDRASFNPITVIISKTGNWGLIEEGDIPIDLIECTSTIGAACSLMRLGGKTILITIEGHQIPIDIAFPLIHGPKGEDGALQGLFELMCLPYVGSKVLASAICMDKDIFKKLTQQAGILTVPYITIYDRNKIPNYEEMVQVLESEILFVKPAVLGSSVGISKVRSASEYHIAILEAFNYGSKVLVEKYIKGREIECAVLGNNAPLVSDMAEIKPTHDFYSYESKYIDPNGAEFIVPAKLPAQVVQEIQNIALQVFQLIGCKGMVRVDFFVTEENIIYLNEANTIPGFTSISMYPRLCQEMGVSYKALVSKLIELAYEHSKLGAI